MKTLFKKKWLCLVMSIFVAIMGFIEILMGNDDTLVFISTIIAVIGAFLYITNELMYYSAIYKVLSIHLSSVIDDYNKWKDLVFPEEEYAILLGNNIENEGRCTLELYNEYWECSIFRGIIKNRRLKNIANNVSNIINLINISDVY